MKTTHCLFTISLIAGSLLADDGPRPFYVRAENQLLQETLYGIRGMQEFNIVLAPVVAAAQPRISMQA